MAQLGAGVALSTGVAAIESAGAVTVMGASVASGLATAGGTTMGGTALTVVASMGGGAAGGTLGAALTALACSPWFWGAVVAAPLLVAGGAAVVGAGALLGSAAGMGGVAGEEMHAANFHAILLVDYSLDKHTELSGNSSHQLIEGDGYPV